MYTYKPYQTRTREEDNTREELALQRRREQHALGDQTDILEQETDDAINTVEYSDEFKPFELENVERKPEEIDSKIQEKLEREFSIYAEQKLKLIDQGIDLIPIVKKRSPTKEEKKNTFIKNRDKFLKRMNRSEHNFWGTDKYYLLLNKWFPDYTLVLEHKVSEIKNTTNDSITDFNQKISTVIKFIEDGLIRGTEGDINTALRLINDSETYLTEAVKSKDNAIITLNGFPESKTQDFLPQYDTVLNLYRELIQNLQTALGGMESDNSKFESTISQLSKQQASLIDFNLKVQSSSDVLELVQLQNTEFTDLINSTAKIIEDAKKLERTADAPDSDLIQSKLDEGKASIATLDKKLVEITEGVSSVYWGKGIYYNEEVDALYIVATDYSAAAHYTRVVKFDGFWFFVDSETGWTSTMQQRDSVKKFNQMNYTYSDALIDELYIVSQNKTLRDRAKSEHELGTAFTLLVKSVQDKLFKKKPFLYGMYTKDTRDKVQEYIKVYQQEEDLRSDMSTNQGAYYNLTPFYSEDYFTSSQVDAINMLYDTKTLYELLYMGRTGYATWRPEQRKREIERAITCRNLFPTWTLQQWIDFMDRGEAPDGVVIPYIWDVSKWPKDKEKYYKARSYAHVARKNGKPLPSSSSWKPMFQILFALENTKNYGPLVDGKIDTYSKFEKALETYQDHLDDGKSLREHIKKDNMEISFKSSYENFLWKRSNEMMDQGKEDLKTEFSRYASVTANKASAGKGMQTLATELKPVYDLIEKADAKRQEANKEPHQHTRAGSFCYTDNYKRCMSLATKYEMEAVQKFRKLIPTHPMLGSIEFEVENVNQIYKTIDQIPGSGVPRSSELTEIIRFVKATQNDQQKAAVILYNIYKDRSADIRKLEAMLREKPERVWQLHHAIEQTKADLGFDPESSYATMIDHWKKEYAEDKDFWMVVSQIGLGLLTIIFPVIAPITVPIIVTISTVEFSKHYDQYQFEKAASGGTYNKNDALGGSPPSVIWLVIDVIGIALDVIDIGILARNIARSAKEAKLIVDGSLIINQKNIDIYRSKLYEYLDVKNLKNATDKDKIIAKLTDEIQLREAQRLESEKIARTNLLQSRTRSQLGEIPEHVLKLFKQPEIGKFMEAGAHRLKKIGLYDFAIDYFSSSIKQPKLAKLFLIAGESQELTATLSKISKSIGSKGYNMLGLGHFLDYALGGTTTQYQKFFRNIETFNITQKQLNEAAEIAAKSTTPEKAAQLFYDEIVKAADTNKVFTRNQLESIPVVNNNDQKRMIADQIEENRRIKEELDGGSKENGNLGESSLNINHADNLYRSKAEELINNLAQIEPKITDDLINISKSNRGKMEGLEYRLKTVESLERKLISDGINTPMNDVLRYTIIIDDDLTKVVTSIIKDLESKGYITIKLKNTFQEGQIYKGINSNIKTQNGSIFEIQYHTSESFNVKQNINHSLYEEYRLLDKTSQEAINLEQQMIENSNIIKLPQNINTIKSY